MSTLVLKPMVTWGVPHDETETSTLSLARSPYFCWLCPYIRPKLTRIPLLIIWVYGGYNELVFMCFLEATKRTGGPSHCLFGGYLDISYIRVIFCGKIYRMDTQLDTWIYLAMLKMDEMIPLGSMLHPLDMSQLLTKMRRSPKVTMLGSLGHGLEIKISRLRSPLKNGPHLKTPIRPVSRIHCLKPKSTY